DATDGRAMTADAAGLPARPPQGGTDPEAAVLTGEEYALFAPVGRARGLAPALEPGECLFRRGDLGTTMYVIAQGAVDLDFGDDLVGKRLGVREFFGELGLLIGDHARSADATAAGPCVVLELRQQE